MKIGIFADIHGNIYAFEKVWRKLQEEACDIYIFVGDICGYYYYQNEVIEILKEIKNLICVAGNHDKFFLKMLEDDEIETSYTKKYGRSCELLKATMTTDNLNFMKKLPEKYIIDEYKVAVFHGSPWNYLNEYIYPTDPISQFRDLPYKFILLGHTHYPMNKKINGLHIINPGSCGQPRDCSKPVYATLDLESQKVEFKRIEYNVDILIEDVIKYSEKNKYLIDVLNREC